MKLTLHHINLSTTNVEAMDDFYQDVLGLNRETEGLPVLEKTKGYAGDVAFVSDGAIQVHLATRDIEAGFRTGLIVNPVSRGHIAYRCDDLAAFKAHLETKGIPYSDWVPNGCVIHSFRHSLRDRLRAIEVHHVDQN